MGEVGVKEVKDLRLPIDSRYPVIVIETREARHAPELLPRIATAGFRLAVCR